MTVKPLPAGRLVKPQIYIGRIHVSFQFHDSNQQDISDAQFEAVPMQPRVCIKLESRPAAIVDLP
jgi:hypothetical protein